MGETINFIGLLIVFLLVMSLFVSDGQEVAKLPQADDSNAKEILVPPGYDFIGAFAYGRYIENTIYIFRENATGRIFKSDGKKIGNEIIIPPGSAFICASAYGEYSANVAYYVRNMTDGKVYKIEI